MNPVSRSLLFIVPFGLGLTGILFGVRSFVASILWFLIGLFIGYLTPKGLYEVWQRIKGELR